MIGFGRALPRMRRRITRDLKLPAMPREKVLATIVRLLETTLIRVGNTEYARDNGSYGLTTFHNRHVKLKGDRVRFRFRGKHGIQHEIEVHDPRAARVLRKCMDLPGQDLFEYIDHDGTVRDVGSSEVNEYLREVTGDTFTAKDFRTWHATSDALEALTGRHFETAREAREALKKVLEDISGRLGNTPAMCRKCYINPVVVDAFLAGELRSVDLRGRADGRARLLQLWRAPAGVGFGGVSRKRKRKRPARGAAR